MLLTSLFAKNSRTFKSLLHDPKTKDKDFEIFKIQVDDIILPWVADGVPMYWNFRTIFLSKHPKQNTSDIDHSYYP